VVEGAAEVEGAGVEGAEVEEGVEEEGVEGLMVVGDRGNNVDTHPNKVHILSYMVCTHRKEKQTCKLAVFT
jgi:hypothetical protein